MALEASRRKARLLTDFVAWANDHEAAIRAGDRAADNHHMGLRIDLHELEISNRPACVAVVPGHLSARKDSAGAGIAARTTGMAVYLFHAVRGALALKAMPFHHAGEAATLGGTRDIDSRNAVEELDRQHLADRKPIPGIPKLTNEPLRFAIGFRKSLEPGCGTPPLGFAIQ